MAQRAGRAAQRRPPVAPGHIGRLLEHAAAGTAELSKHSPPRQGDLQEEQLVVLEPQSGPLQVGLAEGAACF